MLKDLVLKDRSYRGYHEERKVTRDELIDMVDDARLTASGGNKQPLKYYISTDKEEVEAILATTKWAAALPELHLPKPGTHPTAFVIILQDSDIQPNMQAAMIDIGITAQTITLSATEKGLGCLMIRNFGLKPLTEVLGLSENLVPVLVIAIGAPAEKIELVPVPENGDVNYYRDENGTHYVPKRALEDIVLEKK